MHGDAYGQAARADHPPYGGQELLVAEEARDRAGHPQLLVRDGHRPYGGVRVQRRLEGGAPERAVRHRAPGGGLRERGHGPAGAQQVRKAGDGRGQLARAGAVDEAGAGAAGEGAHQRPVTDLALGEQGHRLDGEQRGDVQPGDVVGDDEGAGAGLRRGRGVRPVRHRGPRPVRHREPHPVPRRLDHEPYADRGEHRPRVRPQPGRFGHPLAVPQRAARGACEGGAAAGGLRERDPRRGVRGAPRGALGAHLPGAHGRPPATGARPSACSPRKNRRYRSLSRSMSSSTKKSATSNSGSWAGGPHTHAPIRR